MASPTITTQGTMAGVLLPTYWDSVLGENLYPNLYFYQFGTKRTVPRNFGRFIKIPRLRKQNIVTTVTEGSPIGTCPISADIITISMSQFGGAYKHSDLLIMTALSDVIELSLIDISRDIARRMDKFTRNQLSGKGTFLSAAAGDAPARAYKPRHFLQAATILDNNDNPRPPDNHYPTVIHPAVTFDIISNISTNSLQWLEVTKYTVGNVNRAYIGEIGRLFGARFVTSTNIRRKFISSSGAVSGFECYMFAPDSYYVTEVSDMTARTYVKNLGSAGAADPINQFATVGAKVFFGAGYAGWTATENRLVRLKFGSALVPTAATDPAA